MKFMEFCDLIEDAAQKPNMGKFERIWFHPDKGMIGLPLGHHIDHSIYVLQNKEVFDISDQNAHAHGIDNRLYNGQLLYAVMQKGWVRVVVNRRDPWTNSNFEGTDWNSIKTALTYYYYDFPKMTNCFVTQRTGPEDMNGTAYIFKSNDEISGYVFGGSTVPSKDVQRIKSG
jgi:hypothetical protein